MPLSKHFHYFLTMTFRINKIDTIHETKFTMDDLLNLPMGNQARKKLNMVEKMWTILMDETM